MLSERTPHDTHHTFDDSWPLAIGLNAAGQSVHVCRDCRAEIPDGACVERGPTGQVVAWTPAGVDADGAPIRNVVHECGA